MRALLVWLVLVPIPAVLFYLAARALEWVTRPGPLLRRRRAVTPRRSVPALVADLHRLDLQYKTLSASPETAQWARLRAVALAYDDALLDCCRALEIRVEGSPPLRPQTRLSVEAELAVAGLSW